MDTEDKELETAEEVDYPTDLDDPLTDIPFKKKRKQKLLIALVVIIVIIGGLSIGFVAWHGDPGFCNAICHSPMDPYVERYYSGDELLLVTTHADSGDKCLDCHTPTLSEQLAELGVWVSGDFSDPIIMTNIGTTGFCLRCHDYDEAFASTVNYGGSGRNPHEPHGGEGLDCSSCHRVHRESIMYCNYCHADIPAPAGWIKP